MDERLHHHCQIVADAAREGEVVFLLGAGANLCGRPAGVKWQAGGPYLPTGGELAEYLAMRYRMPHTERPDLARVAQYVAAERGSAKLSKELHTLFDVECAPTALHMLLARLPGLLEQSGSPAPYQFIVTTNYDDVLERAFRESGARFDLFVYQASGPDHGRLKHHPFDGEPHVITEPNRLVDIGSDRSVILKIHGAIDRKDALHDSWVITEQHYVDYLTQTDISTWLPVGLARRDRKASCRERV